MTFTATYSPEDNKLRLYASTRLDKELYERVRAAGFIWAPRQELFVALAWNPEREDLLLELAGEIGDEDKSLVERQEERAERFQEYRESRIEDAENAREAVARISDGIPMGQPILIGHHSEKHARKDAERIENGMRRAVKMWETAEYWKQRAKGAIRHAKYKELPAVRARRIKGIESDIRSYRARFTPADNPPHVIMQEGYGNSDGVKVPHVWCAPRGGRGGSWVKASSLPALEAYYSRWIRHCENRLEYERAMLADSGGTNADQVRPEVGGACKAWCSWRGGYSTIRKVNKVSVTLLDNWGNGGQDFTRTIPFDKLTGLMTRAQVDALREAGKLLGETPRGFHLSQTREEFDEREKREAEPQRFASEPIEHQEQFEGMKESLRAGVQVTSANQLFPTPPNLAARMVEMAEIEDGSEVLEPSAGTGRILDALINDNQTDWKTGKIKRLVAVETNTKLAHALRTQYACADVTEADFLTCNGNLGKFDRILMNPPFENGSDIKHIKHAVAMLKPGGRLVAICANGPRQTEQLKPLASEWEDLPAGTFDGTGVRAALLTIEA
jgi:phospholipid N-methyltransferase